MNKNLNFKLSEPIEITINGEFEEVYEVTLKAPSFEERDQACVLKQFLTRAMKEVASDVHTKREDTSSVEGSDIDLNAEAVSYLLMSSKQNMSDLFKAFATLCTRVCYMTDTMNIKRTHLSKMPFEDVERMCFEYIANFMKPSVS